jgi:hypothetical protein
MSFMKSPVRIIVLLGVVVTSLPAYASENPGDSTTGKVVENEGPAGRHFRLKDPEPAFSTDEIIKNARLQSWGHGFLGAGFILILGGIALIEVDPWGDIGLGGFITVGVGIAVWTVSMFLLGFSRPVHEKVVLESDQFQ